MVKLFFWRGLGLNRVLLLLLAWVLTACGSAAVTSKKTLPPARPSGKETGLRALDSRFSGKVDRSIEKLLKDAQTYLGVPYKYGGSTRSGFDCSGFTWTVFEQNAYVLPRRSADQAAVGKRVAIGETRPGDLVFFATSGGARVSHVGIVYDVGRDGEVRFIHASTSKGVIISSLNESYWNKAYLHTQRLF
ncbi:C40 family peptidase [Bergeyella sp. RCAD1439]|uniref:C40 family peptidase n=1 Tax=Bergeyella anatis TaxID=3113737 RepID=UPI002E19AC56|nr:C40 family peptidase [Bergeyella sp. RCAD1439]